MTDRRGWLKRSVAALPAAAGASGAPAEAAAAAFPVHDVTRFGAVADGRTLNSAAMQAAVDAAERQGGGVVYVPPGDFLSGSIRLKKNVTLHLEAGATILASRDRKDYQFSSLISAEGAPNAAVRGRGVIDGSGEAFWKREKDRWVAGGWRPSALMRFVRCDNLLLEDVTLRNSPAWTVHPVDCDRVNIRGISILTGVEPHDKGPNQDGIDPDGCTRVRISDCYIQSSDDAIVLKITRRPGGNRVCRDVTVTNCVLLTHETALKIGSETYGEFHNITFSNCAIRDAGCGVGLWMRDGGLIDGWTVSNISMTLAGGGTAVYMTSYPRSRLPEGGIAPYPDEGPPGLVRNINISNVSAQADGCVFLSGMEEKPLEQITLENVRIRMRGVRAKEWHADPPYPFRVWGHRFAPYDVYCRYVKDLKLRNVQIVWEQPEKAEWASAIRCRGVRGLEIEGFTGRQAQGSEAAAIRLIDTENVYIHGSRPAEGAGDFLSLEGRTRNVAVMNNDLANAKGLARLDPGVAPGELFESGNRKGGRA